MERGIGFAVAVDVLGGPGEADDCTPGVGLGLLELDVAPSRMEPIHGWIDARVLPVSIVSPFRWGEAVWKGAAGKDATIPMANSR